ncbi:F-box/LRR-repeat protein 17 [Forsythia ovata]|uniref:F-box/LRR-repeat protein 17 n=1 Tax=Forsythia ovata TaxID=205694 RepID=A0ABD1VMQ1_9LAMI
MPVWLRQKVRKATLCIHTDKVQQKDATLQHNCIAEKVFDLVKHLPQDQACCCDNSTPVSTPAPAANDSIISISSVSVSESAAHPLPPLGSRRALSFDDAISEADSQGELELECYEGELDIDLDMPGKFPASCLWEVLRRLPPVGLLSAAMVCKGWRETTKKLWRVAEELQLRLPVKAHIGFFGSMLQKCPGLIKLYYNGK